jgi:fructose/tagatose bisphosphate aldolase
MECWMRMRSTLRNTDSPFSGAPSLRRELHDLIYFPHSSHMVDLSEEPKDENIALTKKYFKRAVPMKQWLEMEIGITGGEEDGTPTKLLVVNANDRR